MTDQNKCTQQQQAYATAHQIPVQQQSTGNGQPYQTSNMGAYNNCTSQVQSILDSCNSTCQTQVENDDNYCNTAYGYQSVNPNPDLQNQCLTDATAKHKGCLDSCTSNQQSGLQQCGNLAK